MTPQEYDRWFRHFLQAYPEAARRFEDVETVQPWENALSDTSLSHAIEAVDAMVRGDLDRPEYGWADLPKIVRQYAIDRANQELQQRTYGNWDPNARRVRCLHCDDNGLTTIWNPLFVQDRIDEIINCEDRFEVIRLHQAWKLDQKRNNPMRVRGCGAIRMMVACCCDHPVAAIKRRKIGEWNDNGRPRDKTPIPCYVYRPELWYVYKVGEPSELEAIRNDERKLA